jgi:hypothetical protein
MFQFNSSCLLHVSNILCSSSGKLYCTVHAALYGNAVIWYNKTRMHNACINAWKTYHIRLHVQYSLPEDEHKMFETCKRQEELNLNINLKSTFC